MPTLEIRDVPPKVLEALERRAAANHRTLERELLVILEGAVSSDLPAQYPQQLRIHLAKGVTPGAWSREDIYDDDGR